MDTIVYKLTLTEEQLAQLQKLGFKPERLHDPVARKEYRIAKRDAMKANMAELEAFKKAYGNLPK